MNLVQSSITKCNTHSSLCSIRFVTQFPTVLSSLFFSVPHALSSAQQTSRHCTP